MKTGGSPGPYGCVLWAQAMKAPQRAKLRRGGIDEIITPMSTGQVVPFPAFRIKVHKRKLENGEILVVSF